MAAAHEQATEPRCGVATCGQPMGGILALRLNGSTSIEVAACREHGAAIEAGDPYRLDLERSDPAIVMGAELAGLDQWQAIRFGVQARRGSPEPLLQVTARRLGTDETHDFELALDPLVRDNLSQCLWMFEAVDRRSTTTWRPLPG